MGLVFLLAIRRNRLDETLAYVRGRDREALTVGLTSRLASYHELLVFWRRYYILRRKDATALEFSSAISFREWEATVRHMTEVLGADAAAAAADY